MVYRSFKTDFSQPFVTQYNKRYILSTLEKIDIFVLSEDLKSFPMIPNS